MKLPRIHFIYILALLYFALFASLTYLRWRSHAPSLDYHAYLQMYWNTANGNILMYNKSSEAQYSLFHAHFAPFLLMIFPIYLLIKHPLTLYFVFGFFISLSFIPLYFFSLERLKSKALAYMVVAAFFLYFPFSWTHRHGFAEEAFATPLLFMAFYSLHKKRPWLYTVFSFLTLSLRINMVIPVFLLGIYSVMKNKIRPHGVFVCTLSVVWLLYTLFVLYPKYNIPGTPYYIYSFFGGYGRSPGEIATNMILNPSKTFGVLVSEQKIGYVKDLFGPVLFLSFLAPDILFIGIPVLLINMLASYPRLSSSWTYYHSSSLPFIWLALCVALERLGKLWERVSKKLKLGDVDKTIPVAFILAVIIILNFRTVKNFPSGQYLPFSKWFNLKIYEINKRDEIADKIINSIPRVNSVAAPHGYLEHTAERKWQFPTSNFAGYSPDIAIFDTLETSDNFQNTPYTKILEDSFFFLYARNDLTREYSIKDFVERAYKDYDSSSEYLIVLRPEESFSSYTNVIPGIPIEISYKYKLAQKLSLQKGDPYILEIPIERGSRAGLNDLFVDTFSKALGNLKVEILEGNDFRTGYKRIHSLIYKPEDITHKSTMLYINLQSLNLDPEKTYWLTLALDQDRQNERQIFNNYNIYLTPPGQPESSSNLFYTLDSGRTWSSDLYTGKDLTYSISYGRISSPYRENTLENASLISKGTPSRLKSQLEKILNDTKDYKTVTIIGSITERL